MNKKPKILIVDDKPENLVALEKVLEVLDVEIIRANSGNEALKATLYHDFALALLDIQMPDMDGYELAEILRGEEKTSRLPFIFISAVYTDNLNMFKGYERGAFSFITKPFQPEILINKVKFFITIYEQDQQVHRLNTELLERNEELRVINAELESFSYSISHDLRAPLRAINGYMSILYEDHYSKMDKEAQHLVDVVLKNSNRMGMLIDDLLAFSRLGRKEVTKESFSMKQLVMEVWEEQNKAETERPIEFSVDELPDVKAERNLIRQVWVNLISNALKYSSKKEKTSIRISFEKKENEIIYSIRDNGAGFDMKYYSKLFGVFQRLHSQQEFTGTGVGLAIVQKVLEKHKGRIWADAKVDGGATFYFSLPL